MPVAAPRNNKNAFGVPPLGGERWDETHSVTCERYCLKAELQTSSEEEPV
jgi:hypothetical protein